MQDIVPHPQLDILDKALLAIGRLSGFGIVAARMAEL
jgi:hypothetical protein